MLRTVHGQRDACAPVVGRDKSGLPPHSKFAASSQSVLALTSDWCLTPHLLPSPSTHPVRPIALCLRGLSVPASMDMISAKRCDNCRPLTLSPCDRRD